MEGIGDQRQRVRIEPDYRFKQQGARSQHLVSIVEKKKERREDNIPAISTKKKEHDIPITATNLLDEDSFVRVIALVRSRAE